MLKSFAIRALCAVTCLLSALAVRSEDASKVTWFTPAFPSVPAFSVPAGEGQEYSGIIEFPALPKKEGMTAVLRFDARFLSGRPSGWNNLGGVEVNGKLLDETIAAGSQRLLGRGNIMETTHAKEKRVAYWKSGKLLLLFAPDNLTTLDDMVTTEAARKMGYEYYLNLSDVVNFLETGLDDRVESDKPNRIRIINYMPKASADTPVSVKNLTIGYVPTAMIGKLSGNMLREVKKQQSLETLSADGFQLNVLESGALSLSVGKETIGIDSSFSYVSQPKMKFNELSAANTAPVGEKEFKFTCRKLDDRSCELRITAKSYQIVRTLTVNGNTVNVKDAYTNTTKDDIGIILKNECFFSGTMPSQKWRLCGQTGIAAEDVFGSRNPTIYAKHNDAAVLMLLEDTVSRTLIDARAAGNVFTLGSTGMGIGAGKTVTLEWTIYAGTKVDYWDFINQIRRAWNVNVTVPGPYLIRASALPKLNIQFASVAPWLDYADGATLTREEYKEVVGKQVAELRKKFPGIKLMGLIENNLITFDVSQFSWGKEMPLTYGDRSNPKTKYGQYINKELSRKLDAATPFSDSFLHDKDGNDMIDNHYIYGHYPFINLMVQPENENCRYQFYLNQIDFLMDEMGFEGVYIDQFNPTPRDGRTYDRWDGVSVTLNPDGTIASKFCDFVIAGATARMNVIKYIVEKKHGVVLTNGHPVTREEQSSGRLSFCEVEWDNGANPMAYMNSKPSEIRNEMLTHLASPIILGLRPSRFPNAVTDTKDNRAQIINKGIIAAIHNGVLYYYYGTDMALEGPDAGSYEVSNWLFPFTPVELREDVLVGKERTITVVSGKYTVAGNKQPKIGYFNDHGLPQDASKFKVTGKPGAWTVDVKLDNWNEIAVIEVQD